MRCLFTILLVAATTGLIPALVMAGNQEAAEQIAANLRNSGKLGTSKVTVKYMDGTAWLEGTVRDKAQMNAIVRVVDQTTGVRQVVNEMTVAGQGASQESGTMGKLGASLSGLNPLRRSEDPKRAEVVPTSAMQPIPTPAPPPAGAKPIPPAPLPPAVGGAPVANGVPGGPLPMHAAAPPTGMAPMRTDNPAMPGYAWPSYAAYPNYAAVTYPKQYSPTAWPYIGPFYPYPQVPLGWRKVTMEWDDGWWFLDFKDEPRSCWWR